MLAEKATYNTHRESANLEEHRCAMQEKAGIPNKSQSSWARYWRPFLDVSTKDYQQHSICNRGSGGLLEG